ncbi:Asx homology domain-containing protein [Halteromyces radiatus]|uniref:Asx homology domain-containing protein n=1 Tax=Halteromyces radiatus TaxID=101107 RepID=UPI002220C768|nr:Asx homology domain-containing protein [Halteromyces radiatus]KAI8092999.1 Asx homology domain-containing protein [Halteromyces radiatus]
MHPEEDVTAETKRLLIRSPEIECFHSQPNSFPFKRLKQQEECTVDYLSTHASSPLAQVDLDSIFNLTNFQLLPPEKQDELAKLLPTPDTITTIDHMAYLPSCPSSASTSSTSLPLDESLTTTTTHLHPSFFSRNKNPVFWNALDDWQSMLVAGDLMNQKETDGSQQIQSSVGNTPFKDEAFEMYWGELSDREKLHNVAGDSKSITLKDMCRKGLIRENDVIVYKRNFSACKVIVSKSMEVVKADGTLGLSITLDDQIYEDFETPTALETKILDHHGKVSRDKRPNGNAFKSIRLIRDGKDMGRLFDIRKDAFGT